MSRQHYVRPLRLTDEGHKQTVRCACGEHVPAVAGSWTHVHDSRGVLYRLRKGTPYCRHCGKVLEGAEQAQGGAR